MSAGDRGLRRVYLAGINGSEPGHWQALWKNRDPGGIWVEHADWANPDLALWLKDLETAISDPRGPVLVIAHSLGCYLAAAWATKRRRDGLLGLFLVAPPDLSSDLLRGRCSGFETGLRSHLACQGVLVASRDDPYAHFDRSAELALRWGLPFIDAGENGHINLASGLDDWPLGRAWLGAFEKRYFHVEESRSPAA